MDIGAAIGFSVAIPVILIACAAISWTMWKFFADEASAKDEHIDDVKPNTNIDF